MKKLVPYLRSVVAVLAGLLLISALVEGLEYFLVSVLSDQPITNPVDYYAIRNLTWFLIIKLIYNTLAAIAGGFVTALIAGNAPFRHAIALAVIQTLSFVWILTQPDLSQWTPLWVWLSLILLSIGGILLGARIQMRRVSTAKDLE